MKIGKKIVYFQFSILNRNSIHKNCLLHSNFKMKIEWHFRCTDFLFNLFWFKINFKKVKSKFSNLVFEFKSKKEFQKVLSFFNFGYKIEKWKMKNFQNSFWKSELYFWYTDLFIWFHVLCLNFSIETKMKSLFLISHFNLSKKILHFRYTDRYYKSKVKIYETRKCLSIIWISFSI